MKEVLHGTISIENSADSYLCLRQDLLQSVSLCTSKSLCTVFDSISSNIDKVLSINPSANVFVFGDFNVHHKDWLTYSGGTDRPAELCYSSFKMTLLRWLTFLLRSLTVILRALLFWIYLFYLFII